MARLCAPGIGCRHDHGCAPAGLGRRNDDDTGRRYLGDALYAGPGRAVPAVLLLHGFASSKDEVGNMYAREAKALAEKGIASLRIDFAGFGKKRGRPGFDNDRPGNSTMPSWRSMNSRRPTASIRPASACSLQPWRSHCTLLASDDSSHVQIARHLVIGRRSAE